MKRTWVGMLVAFIAMFIMLVQNGASADNPKEDVAAAAAEAEVANPAKPAGKVTVQVDRKSVV